MIMFQLLGPASIAHQPPDSAVARVRGVRAVLATLLHHTNQHVTTDRLAECVWPTPPASAYANLRTHITTLRRALNGCSTGLGQRLITRRGPGDRAAYQLTATPDEIDAVVFTTLADQGHEQLITHHPGKAAQTLRAALRLWRGPIGEDLPDTLAQRAWAAELTERHLTAGDDLAEAQLHIADHTALIPTLRRRLATNPHRERTAELLIRALHATADRPAAITAYEQFRTQLAHDLGIEPSTRLQRIHIALLKDEPMANSKQPPTPLRAHAPTRRLQAAHHPPTKRRQTPSHPPPRR
jgi:DNA-binding SARP family transcriptional activator